MDKVKFSQPLRFLNVIGLDPFKNDSFSNLRLLFLVLIFSMTGVSTFLELCLNFNNLPTVIRATEIIFPYYHCSLKIIVLIKYRRELRQLIEDSEHFWSLDQLGPLHQMENLSNHKFLQKCFLAYQVVIYFSCSQYILIAIWSDKPTVLSYGETQGLTLKFKLLYLILHSIQLFLTVHIVMGFDGLFFYLVAHILSELKMIKIAFGDEEIQPCWSYKERFRLALQHHIFVLDFIRLVDRVFNFLLLNQHFVYLCGLCFGSFLLIHDGVPPDFEHLQKYLPYVAGFVFQVWMFSFAGDLVVNWSQEIPDQVFYDDWSLDRAYQNKQEKIFIIQRGQNAARLTLGGFRDLDLRSFTVVVKNAMSFFTFMNTITEPK